jgi:uncharacterized protein DUF6152
MRTRFSLAVAVALAVSALATTAASAHHSLTVEFDISRTMTMTGVITDMKWTNPHAWLYLDVKDEKGLVRNWAIEFASPNGLYRRGWRQTDLPPRNTVTVTGYPSLDKSPRISATDVKLPDGRTLFAGSPTTGGQ